MAVIYASDLFTNKLNISMHYWARYGDFLPTVYLVCQNFGPHCIKLLGNLTIWRAVLNWYLARSFLQFFLGHYSVRIGYQREQNFFKSFKAWFLNRSFTFCAILGKSCSKKLHVEKKKVAI